MSALDACGVFEKQQMTAVGAVESLHFGFTASIREFITAGLNRYITQRSEVQNYATVWPGFDDSAYPINLRQIVTAQTGQQHWTEAEQSLLKSISVFDEQIAVVYRTELLSIRIATANASGDPAAQEIWTQRNPNQ